MDIEMEKSDREREIQKMKERGDVLLFAKTKLCGINSVNTKKIGKKFI